MTLYYPPEWTKQRTVWLSFPHNQADWEADIEGHSRFELIRGFYFRLIEMILDYQSVSLIFPDAGLQRQYQKELELLSHKKFNLDIYVIKNNDIWIRDYGPFFVKNPTQETEILNYKFNCWGQKFAAWDFDDLVPMEMSQRLGYKQYEHSLVMEGGSLEFNGDGVILTTKQCLLNTNRNPHLQQVDIEANLKEAFNIEEIIWLERGLEGDHTDGHIDDFARFIDYNKVILCQADNTKDENYQHLLASKEELLGWQHPSKQYKLDIIDLPLPTCMSLAGERLPNSYANFIFVNEALIVPVFACDEDQQALEILQKAMPDRKILSIDARVLIQEGGGLHCMSKQEPV